MRYGDHEVKSHAYFKGVDWHTMHITTLPPFEPVRVASPSCLGVA